MQQRLASFFLLSLFCGLSSARAGGESPCRDEGKVYQSCASQEKLFQAAIDRAKAEKRLLVAVLGAEWCPWCISLHRLLSDPGFGGPLAGKYVLAGVALYEGKKRFAEGEAVLKRLQEQAGVAKKLEGIPILAVVDPKNRKAVVVDTEPLEQNTLTSKGHDPKKVQAALSRAASQLR